MVVIVTGTPGTGKSTFARKLASDEDRTLVSISDLVAFEGLDAVWDDEMQTYLVDTVKLNELLEKYIEEDPNCVIDGHLSQEVDPAFVDRCVVMKCELKELESRLVQRGYSDSKVRENLDSEIFDVCFVEALERGHNPEVVWSSNQQV